MYAGVLYTQPSWCSFSSWPHSDITSLSRSVTCTFLTLPFFTAEKFLETLHVPLIYYDKNVYRRVAFLGRGRFTVTLLHTIPSSHGQNVLRLLGKTNISVDFSEIVLATSYNIKHATVPGVSQNISSV